MAFGESALLEEAIQGGGGDGGFVLAGQSQLPQQGGAGAVRVFALETLDEVSKLRRDGAGLPAVLPWLRRQRLEAGSASDFEMFIPVDSDFQAIAKAMVQIYELVHPEKRPTPPPKPERPRPSNQEALAAVPGLMKQFYGALEEISFLFQRSLLPSGYLDDKIGEIIAAYIYDLELTRSHSDFSEAKTSDGRSVQVRSTRAQASRETVLLHRAGDHLLVVQLWGREVIEVFNGPLEPIWAAAKRIQKDGTRRISMGLLRGQNKYRVPVEQKIQAKRAWKLEQQENQGHERL